jgi:DNA-binding XRE family transcriptional regulator
MPLVDEWCGSTRLGQPLLSGYRLTEAFEAGSAWGHLPQRRNIPALPFCQVTLRAIRQKEGYPKQLRSLGDHIRRRRLDLGLRQRDVVAALGAGPDTVCHWETGRTGPPLGVVPRIVEFLGYDPQPPPETPGRTSGWRGRPRAWSSGK